jgi:hypothetical protein
MQEDEDSSDLPSPTTGTDETNVHFGIFNDVRPELTTMDLRGDISIVNQENLVQKMHHSSESIGNAATNLARLQDDRTQSVEALEADYEKKRDAAKLAKAKLEKETKIYADTKAQYDQVGSKTAAALEAYKEVASEHKEYEAKYVAAWKSYHRLEKEALRAEQASATALQVKTQKVGSIDYWNQQLEKGESELEQEKKELEKEKGANAESQKEEGRSGAPMLPAKVVLTLCMTAFFLAA